MASIFEPTGKSVMSFQSIGFRLFGAPRSCAWITVKVQRGVALLLADRRQDVNAAVSEFKNRLAGAALAVADLDAVQPLDGNLSHCIRDCVVAIASQTVNAGSHQKMGSRRMRRAEQLVDVALAVADVDTSWRFAEKLCGLRQIFKPSHALLLLDGDPRGIDLLLERVGAFELLARPELDGRQSQRQPFGRHRETRMHQDAANRVRPHPASLVPAAVDAFRRTDEGGLFSLINELRGVMEDQHRSVSCRKTIPCRMEMAAQDVCFADPLIGEEAVGRFGVRPVLANQGNALAHGAPDPLQQLSEIYSQAGHP